jgi:hypothetical protein
MPAVLLFEDVESWAVAERTGARAGGTAMLTES